jgi:signal transduction histidine kinase
MSRRNTVSPTWTVWAGLAGIILLFCVYLWFSVNLNRQLQEEAVRFKENFVWAVIQIQKEMLQTVVQAEKAILGAEVSQEDLNLSYELLVSRILLLRDGDGFRELDEIDGFQDRLVLIMEDIAVIDDYLSIDRSTTDFAAKLIERLGAHQPVVQEMALDALHHASKSNTERNEEVRAKLDGLAALYLLNTLLIGGSIFLAFRQAMRARENNFRAETEARERKFLEDTAEAAKLQALGTLAGGVAHEINSPAQFISSNLEFSQDGVQRVFSALDSLIEQHGLPPELERSEYELYKSEIPLALQEATVGIQRIAEIVRAIKSFAHPSENPEAEIDVNDEIRSAVLLTANQTKTIASVETELDDNLPTVTGKQNDLNQILINLIINSVQAIQETDNRPGNPVIRIVSERAGDEMLIRVMDNGPGVPADVSDKIFNPFFTTKPVGVGSGQGLAISRKLVNTSFNGELELNEDRTEGCEFVISIPLSPASSN